MSRDAFEVARRCAQRLELTHAAELGELFASGILAAELCRRVNECACTECPVAASYAQRIAGLLRTVGLPMVEQRVGVVLEIDMQSPRWRGAA